MQHVYSLHLGPVLYGIVTIYLFCFQNPRSVVTELAHYFVKTRFGIKRA